MMGFTQLLTNKLEELKHEDKIKYLNHIEVQTHRIANLINDLLLKSKNRAHSFSFNDKFFDINKLIQEIIEVIYQGKVKHRIIVKGHVKDLIYADPDRIRQVIENFLTNAIKYSPDASKVLVAIYTRNENLTVRIKDFGIGIAKKDIKKIFSPFFRAAETQKEKFTSIGLGLHISAEIVKHYDGKIGVRSILGKGSTFYFTIPFKEHTKLKSNQSKAVPVVLA